MRGATKKREIRLKQLELIKEAVRKDFKKLDTHNLWLAGVMLYWAEGSKEKSHNIGQQTIFNNSDPKMIKLFVKWLKEIIGVSQEDLIFEIYIHKTGDVKKALDWWSNVVSCEKEKFKVYFKRHQIKRTNRKNTGENYHGSLRVKVRKSSLLNRKIAAWTNHICNYWGVV